MLQLHQLPAVLPRRRLQAEDVHPRRHFRSAITAAIPLQFQVLDFPFGDIAERAHHLPDVVVHQDFGIR